FLKRVGPDGECLTESLRYPVKCAVLVPSLDSVTKLINARLDRVEKARVTDSALEVRPRVANLCHQTGKGFRLLFHAAAKFAAPCFVEKFGDFVARFVKRLGHLLAVPGPSKRYLITRL